MTREEECTQLRDRLDAVLDELDPTMDVALSVLTVLSAETLAAAGDYELEAVPALEFIAYLGRIVKELCAENDEDSPIELSEVKPANINIH